MADVDREGLAKERTDLAQDRTLLANERTYAGWLRTGMTGIAIGLGFQALFQTMQPQWVPKAIATTFLIVAIFIVVAAERRARAVQQRFHPHEINAFKLINLRLITAAIVAATVALIAALWLLA